MKMFGDSVLGRVKWHMYHLDEIRNAVFWRRKEMKKRVFHMDGIKPRGVPSDPTANEAIMNSTPLKVVEVRSSVVYRPEDWIAAISSVTSRLNENDLAFYDAAFKSQKKPETMCELFSVSRGTYFKKRDKFVSLCAIAAAQRGLIEIDEYS